MVKSIQDDLLYLSNAYSKLLKRSFGKGPESCHTLLGPNQLYIYLRNFITPGEEILLEQKHLNLAESFRAGVIQGVSEKFLEIVTKVLGISFDTLYHDWNYDSNTGMLMFVDASTFGEGKMNAASKEELFAQILNISSDLHKTPNELRLLVFNQNICVVEANGVILKLEQYLYENKDLNLLHHWSREIKKGYMKHKDTFEEILARTIDDLFLMWDYKSDKGYFVFNFNRGYPIKQA